MSSIQHIHLKDYTIANEIIIHVSIDRFVMFLSYSFTCCGHEKHRCYRLSLIDTHTYQSFAPHFPRNKTHLKYCANKRTKKRID